MIYSIATLCSAHWLARQYALNISASQLDIWPDKVRQLPHAGSSITAALDDSIHMVK